MNDLHELLVSTVKDYLAIDSVILPSLCSVYTVLEFCSFAIFKRIVLLQGLYIFT